MNIARRSCWRSRSAACRLGLALLVLVAIGGCDKSQHEMLSAEHPKLLDDFLKQLPKSERTALSALVKIPLNYDKQKLRVGRAGKQFGAGIARVWPALGLGSHSVASFEVAAPGRLVAIVHVDGKSPGTPVSDAEYAALHLSYGINCVYAQKSGNDWTGFSWYASTGRCDPPADFAASPDKYRIANRWSNEGLSEPDSFPAVARWDEGQIDGGTTPRVQPTIGVRCGAGWCELGPDGFQSIPPAWGSAIGIPNGVKSRVRGWYDEQVISIPTSGNPMKLEPAYRAVIFPAEDVETLDEAAFENTPREVAVIWLLDVPAEGTKYKKASLGPGKNSITIHYKPQVFGLWKRWYAQVNGGKPEKIDAPHREKDATTFAAARWAWNDDDEDTWVPCGGGCCHVGFGAFQ